MGLNPLKFPKREEVSLSRPAKWDTTGPAETPPPKPQERRLSRREELALQAERAEAMVTLEVRGISTATSGTRKLPYEEDWMLRRYLQRAELVLSGHAMYDTSNYEKGRLRSTYVPAPGATILVCPRNYSPILAERRQKKADAEKVAAKMPSQGEATMVYRNQPKKQQEKRPEQRGQDGVEQW